MAKRVPKTGQLDAAYSVTRMGMDTNGNHSVWVSFRGGRSKKILTNYNLPLTHSDRALTPRAVDELSDFVHRQTNPAPRTGTKRPRRASQITKKPPTTRLVARRKANSKAGYFPNPLMPKVHRKQQKKNINHPVNFPYGVEYLNPGTGHWNILSAFKELKHAKEYAQAWANANPKFSVRVDYLKEV
jgi:hypothetical protein